MNIPRPVLVAGVTALVIAALVAIAVSGPDSPRQPGVGPVASLPPVPLPADSPTVPASPSPRASRTQSASASRSPSKPPAPSPSPTPTDVLSYEAEAPGNLLGSGARVASMDGASGAEGVYGIGGRNLGTLTFTGVTVPSFGTYQLTVYYQNPDPDPRTGMVTVNGIPASRDFPTTGSCCVATRTLPVTLRAGTNTVMFTNPVTPAPDIDRIVISQ